MFQLQRIGASVGVSSLLGLAIWSQTCPAWTAESNQNGARFGNSVSTAGDVNGDGYSDLVIAAYLFDNGETDEGRVYAYLGSAAGFSTSPDWTAEPPNGQNYAHFGMSVSTAGDVNGDGYSDVIVGENSQVISRNFVRVYLGSANGLSTSPSWTASGNQDAFGWSVSTAGDVNGDGYDDVIVGAPVHRGGKGRADVYLGSAAGLSTAPAWSEESFGYYVFGISVASAGDVNGDGYDDVIVGAPGDGLNTVDGSAYVYFGSALGLSTSASWIGNPNGPWDQYGSFVATAGDVNGDGYSDVIVGAPIVSNGEVQEGRAYAYFGSASGLGASPDWIVETNQAYAHGFLVATAGDVNGDAYSDVILGAGDFDNGDGRAYVYFGSASGLGASPGWTAESDQASAFGASVATAGDLNGDGFADVIVGAPRFDHGQPNEGRAYVYLGSAVGLGLDSSPPQIACPVVVTALSSKSNPEGTIVSYSVTASDNCDSAPSIQCVPASGSFFPRGTTMVTCTATDASGNSSTCTFPVTVQPSIRRF